MTSFSARAAAFVKFCLFSLAIALALLGPGLASADGLRPFDRIVVFGDSLSDPGNLHEILVANGVDPANAEAPDYGLSGLGAFTLIPSLPYEIGGNRFSNGATWIELLGAGLGLGANVKPAFAPSADQRASNYAVAGATAANLIGVDADASQFHLGVQVGAYLARGASSEADYRTLYVIAIGGNDVRAALRLGPGVLESALAAVAENISRLYYSAGARRFLIWNVPNLGGTPALQRLEVGLPPIIDPIPNITTAATILADGFKKRPGYNDLLQQLLRSLATAPQNNGGLPGIDFVSFDAFSSLNMVQKFPRRFGLVDAWNACIQPYVPPLALGVEPYQCAHPDRHLFWDGIHPTRAGHAIIALLVSAALVRALHDH